MLPKKIYGNNYKCFTRSSWSNISDHSSISVYIMQFYQNIQKKTFFYSSCTLYVHYKYKITYDFKKCLFFIFWYIFNMELGRIYRMNLDTIASLQLYRVYTVYTQGVYSLYAGCLQGIFLLTWTNSNTITTNLFLT